MKKILNGPTVWRAKCPVCDCEFEYDTSETFWVYNKSGDYFRIVQSGDYFRIVQCPNCKTNLKHSESVSTITSSKRKDTIST